MSTPCRYHRELSKPEECLDSCRLKGLFPFFPGEGVKDDFTTVFSVYGRTTIPKFFESLPGTGNERAWLNTTRSLLLLSKLRKVHGGPLGIYQSMHERVMKLIAEGTSEEGDLHLESQEIEFSVPAYRGARLLKKYSIPGAARFHGQDGSCVFHSQIRKIQCPPECILRKIFPKGCCEQSVRLIHGMFGNSHLPDLFRDTNSVNGLSSLATSLTWEARLWIIDRYGGGPLGYFIVLARRLARLERNKAQNLRAEPGAVFAKMVVLPPVKTAKGRLNPVFFCKMEPLSVKKRIRVVVIGDVKSGKSTTTGHLICKLGGVDKQESERAAEMNDRISTKYAWVLGKLRAERERGITVDIALCDFETTKYICSFVDAPGHSNFIKNMITRDSQADCAVLIIDSTTSDFEAGFGRTKVHALLAFTFGVKQIICCCNKMDATTPKYSKSKFNDIVNKIDPFLSFVGFDPAKVSFVPVSASEGDNLFEKSSYLYWYNGPTLLEALDMISEPKMPTDKPLRIPVEHLSEIGGGFGVALTGRVETGTLKRGMAITFGPTGVVADVPLVMREFESSSEAVAGEFIWFIARYVMEEELEYGNVASNSEDDPAKEAASFTSLVVIMDLPVETDILPGYTQRMRCHIVNTDVKFTELVSRIDGSSGMELEKGPKSLKRGDVAIVKMVPTTPIVVETYAEYPPLGHFDVDGPWMTVAKGIILSVEKKEPSGGSEVSNGDDDGMETDGYDAGTVVSTKERVEKKARSEVSNGDDADMETTKQWAERVFAGFRL